MRKSTITLIGAVLCCLVSCERSEMSQELTFTDQEQPALKTITITAGLEQPSDPATKTSLGEGNAVLWSGEDQFSLLTYAQMETKDVLVAKASAASTGVGIPVTTTNSTCYVKYSGIKVTKSDGTDITSTFTSTNASSSNTYKVGIYNSASQYQYAAAGTTVKAQFNTSNSSYMVLPIVQASSKSSVGSTNLYVQLKDIQYSLDGSNWVSVNENTALLNGSSWGKSNMSYTWINDITSDPGSLTFSTSYSAAASSASNVLFTLNSGEGMTSGTFDGTYPSDASNAYVVYPYASTNTFDGENLTFTLPATQTYDAGTFASGANPAVGKLVENSGSYSVDFKNVCGVLKLKLKGNDTVTAIELTDNTETNCLNGTATVAVANIGTDSGYATVTGGSNSITLNCGDGVKLDPDTATPFYFVVPVGSFSAGLTIKVATLTGVATKTTTVANTISRSVIKAMPTVSTDGMEYILPEFNIENDAADDYLANATVTLSATGDSNYGQSFFDTSRSYRPDQPNTKTIEFSNANSSEVSIVMATDKSFTNTVLNTTTTGTSYTLRNFVPGTDYYYKVTDSSNNILTDGAFTATGQLRMIAIDKGFNIRDLGGWTGLGGYKVKYGLIYRGGSLGGTDMSGTTSDITDDDRAELNRIGIRAQLDLRAATNSGKYAGEYSFHSYSRGETTLTDADFNNTMTDYGAYNQDASVVCDVAWIIYELKQGKPVYFNCRQGADRTGTIAFIIEGLLGCYGSDTGHQMAMDYELTGFSQANLVDNKTVDTSYRSATEAYGNSSKLFNALLNLNVSGITFNNLQEKCYYYLNQYWNNRTESGSSTDTVNLCIDDEDLDWFINYMLGIDSYTHPTWAADGGTLKTVAESKANVVSYK